MTQEEKKRLPGYLQDLPENGFGYGTYTFGE